MVLERIDRITTRNFPGRPPDSSLVSIAWLIFGIKNFSSLYDMASKIVAVLLLFGPTGIFSRLQRVMIGKPQEKELPCVHNFQTDHCCDNFDFDPSKVASRQPITCEITCPKEPERCLKIIQNRIESMGNQGSYFLPENEDEILNFASTLKSIEGLSYDGILKVTLKIHIAWNTESYRWDLNCRNISYKEACEQFVERTRVKKVFVTNPMTTKSYDFHLKYDTTSTLLSKKMDGFPLLIYRNGMVEWSGVIQVSLKCPLDVTRFPMDAQICDIEWLSAPTRKRLEMIFFCHKEKDMMENLAWNLISFRSDKKNLGCKIILKRRSIKIMATLVIPFLLLNLLVFLVYFLPPSSGERVGYSVTLVLSFSVLVMAIGDLVPSSSDITPVGKRRIPLERA